MCNVVDKYVPPYCSAKHNLAYFANPEIFAAQPCAHVGFKKQSRFTIYTVVYREKSVVLLSYLGLDHHPC